MKDLRIFISYSHDDGPIATPLLNLLQAAFEPVLAGVFLDKSAIPLGANIKDSVIEGLRNADILIAVIAGAQPASALSWPGFEIGRFSAFWEDGHYEQGPHKGRKKNDVIGQVFVMINGKAPLGPQSGQRPIYLGISEHRLSDDETDEELTKSRNTAAVENSEVLEFLKSLEEQVKGESDYLKYAKARTKSLPELVRDFKFEVFDTLRNRVRNRSKPSKQLLVRTRGMGLSLTDEAKIISVAGASEVFGRSEGDPRLFKKGDDSIPGIEHFETTWGEFQIAVKDHAYGQYWCGVIEQAAIGAAGLGSEFDSNLVLISSRGQRYRIIATTVTTYFNNDSEVSLYLIEALQRPQRGDMVTSNLLNCLILICRFRFAFLEGTSPYYWPNFNGSAVTPRDLLMELDYLKSEAINANLEQPGAWEEFMGAEQLGQMVKVWNEVDFALRQLCNEAITRRITFPAAPELSQQIVTQLKRISDEVKPFNTLLGTAVSAKLLSVFEKDRADEIGDLKENVR